MSLAALQHETLFNGFVAGGLEASNSVIRQTLVHTSGGSLYAGATGVQYAVWPASGLAALGAPTLQSDAGTTDVLGELTIDASGAFLPSDEVILLIRHPEGAAPYDDDDYGAGAVTVSAS